VNSVDVIEILSGHKEVLMTRLRKMMLEELDRRNYSEATTRCFRHTPTPAVMLGGTFIVVGAAIIYIWN
jgi:hypothetical protein